MSRDQFGIKKNWVHIVTRVSIRNLTRQEKTNSVRLSTALPVHLLISEAL